MIRMLCLVGPAALAGCGLISSDLADVDLSLPDRQITIDTADWQLANDDDGAMPAVACADTPSICTGTQLCGADELCHGECGGQTCEVTVRIALWHAFDLAEDNQALQQIEGQSLVGVTIDRIYYEIVDNTLNVSSPALTVYLAPQGVMSPDAAEAKEVGVIEQIEPGVRGIERDIEVSPDGRQVVADRLRDYQTPFTLIVGSELRLRAGDEIPVGRLDAVVKVDAHAGL